MMVIMQTPIRLKTGGGAAWQPAVPPAGFHRRVPAQFSDRVLCGFFFFPSKLKTKMYLALQSLELDLSKMAGMYW